MSNTPPQPVVDLPNLGDNSSTFNRILSHIDPGPAEESEVFVQLIYEQRRMETSAEDNDEISS